MSCSLQLPPMLQSEIILPKRMECEHWLLLKDVSYLTIAYQSVQSICAIDI